MIKRDMENPTKFALGIKRGLKMQDLQGLCKNSKDEYTIAVEAIYMGDDPADTYEEAFERGELYAKCCLAEQLGIECVVMLHNEESYKDSGEWKKKDVIYVHHLKAEHTTQEAVIVRTDTYDESTFLIWWKTQKYGKQTKGYRKEMGLRIKSSYFDALLESNDSSWSGNIDGFMVEKRGSICEVSAIIECRFSSFENIARYDPNKYFSSGGGDYKIWSGLKQLADTLNVPLYLLTYSRLLKDRNKVSASRVTDVTKTGLKFSGGKPGTSIFSSAVDLKAWMVKNGYK